MTLDQLIKKTEDELEQFIQQANARANELRGRIAGLRMAKEISEPIKASPVEDLPHDMSVEA